MSTKGIIFTHNIPAILAGRKTQTRRPIKLGQPGTFGPSDTPGYDWHFRGTRRGKAHGTTAHLWQDLRHEQLLALAPYQSGDVLYIKEAWHCDCLNKTIICRKADGHHWACSGDHACYRSPMFMPRWAARPERLRVTAVRAERIQDISDADAIAEGCPAVSLFDLDCDSTPPSRHYRDLWNEIHGPGAWARNDWVWAYTFELVEAAQ